MYNYDAKNERGIEITGHTNSALLLWGVNLHMLRSP
jgi:hypothetical protein